MSTICLSHCLKDVARFQMFIYYVAAYYLKYKYCLTIVIRYWFIKTFKSYLPTPGSETGISLAANSDGVPDIMHDFYVKTYSRNSPFIYC